MGAAVGLLAFAVFVLAAWVRYLDAKIEALEIWSKTIQELFDLKMKEKDSSLEILELQSRLRTNVIDLMETNQRIREVIYEHTGTAIESRGEKLAGASHENG